MPGTMRAAIEAPVCFDTVADHSAATVRADGRQGVNGTLEAVEHVRLGALGNPERFVVLVTTDLTSGHDRRACLVSRCRWRRGRGRRRRGRFRRPGRLQLCLEILGPLEVILERRK